MTNIPVSERSNWIGSSESAALFGVSPYISLWELWQTKAGNLPSHNLDGVERVQAGQFLEPSIAAWASHKWHWPLRNVSEYAPHPVVPGLGASLDFETLEGDVVEIKNVDGSIFYHSDDYVADGDVLLDAPETFLIQVQHQLACKPESHMGHLVVCAGGNRLYRMTIERHERMISTIERRVADFWQSIAEGREPPPNFDMDVAAIAQLYSSQGDHTVDLRDDERVTNLCAEYLAAHEIEKGATARKKAALAEIKTYMKDAAIAYAGEGFKVKGSLIKEATFTRKAHRRFLITQQKGK